MFKESRVSRSSSVYEGAVVISIIDYGAGNLRSVCGALKRLNIGYKVVSSPDDLSDAKCILLPGVGNFGHLSAALDDLDLRAPLSKALHDGVPFLGICLGMQILFESSEEAPTSRGLASMEGSLKRLPKEARCPHMGWNLVSSDSDLIPSGYYYFAHSYYLEESDRCIASADTPAAISVGVRKDSIVGVQFHPEKSGELGLEFLRRFAREAKC